ncbi:hypothetical protein HK096_007935 [Nowakowskiella sp. JEL0078]|nr:hypothetical protein HK096_007935 [Nowakowskiella sp. JEL0078]
MQVFFVVVRKTDNMISVVSICSLKDLLPCARSYVTATGKFANVPRFQRGLPKRDAIPGVKHIVVVASGKGGVGKSTTAVNLAVTLASMKRKVGLLDADLFGPSIPRMMNLSGSPEINSQKLEPLLNYGVKTMSMGYLVKEEDPVVWRGLMVMKGVEQLLKQVNWGNLDVLLIDMPPGTGDTHLSVTQLVPISGAVIVSTPQDVALADAKKGVMMFRKVEVPILGLVQNMSVFCCPNCNHQVRVFGDKAITTAKEMDIEILGELPLHEDICTTSDNGTPISLTQFDGLHAKVYRTIAQKILDKIEFK